MLNRFKSAVGSIMDDMGVNKQLKQLHTAITKGNEEAAVQLYTSDSGSTSSSSSSGSNKLQKGKKGSLNQTLDLNDPFKLRGLGDETPMNLVSQSCMVKLCKIFLENGGNPNSLNSSHQSCIHSLCSRPEAPMQRDELLKIFLDWESAGMTGEQASLNQVDLEGNTAVHLAAMNGLLGCVIRLVKAGAIISLVNNSQRTCCELADVGGHADLASMLELALIFQPIDADMAAFDETNTRANSSQLPTYMLDSASKTEGEMTLYMDSLIRRTADVIRETEARTETLLKLTNWNSDELVTACQTHEGKRDIFARSNLHLEEVPALPSDDRVPPSSRDNAKEGDGDLVGAPEHVAKVSGSPNTQRVDDNEGDEVLISGVSVVQKTTGDENLHALKEAEEQAVSNLKPAAGESREPTGQKECEICMVSMRGDVGSYKDFMQRLRARARACVPIDSDSGAPPLTPTTVRLAEEEQDLALTCESGQHSYCLSCWSQHVVAKVSDHGLDCLSCPAFKCGECAPLQWAQVLLQSTNNTRAGVMEVPMAGPDQAQSPELEEQNTLYAGMMHSRTRRFVDTFHASHYCPHTGCDKVVLVNLEQSRRSDLNFGSEALPQTVFCSAGHASCLACKEEGHAPCSCDEYRKWKTAVAKQMQVLGDSDGKPTGAEEVATKLWFNANTKKCPRCGATIEKDEGCNHMTCGNCRHDFCWMCMRPWSEHTNATGGYFVCNRFIGDDDKAAGTGSASADHDDVLGLTTRARGQPGSSSEEAKRQAAANQKMARFIHFFTRFNGHSDSMNKEISIRNATFSRILGNAERTAHGDLAWLRAESPDENITPTPPREIPHSRVSVIGANSSVGSAPTPPPPDSSASSQEEGHSPAPLTGTTEGGSTNPLLSSSPPVSMAEPTTPSPGLKGGMPRHTPQRRRSSSGSIFSRGRLGSGSASGETPLGVFRSLFGGGGNRGGGAGSSDEEGALKVEGLDAIRREEEEGYRQQYSENTSSLLFLRDAFEELSRARIFLKGSYAYGYFKFQDANVRATRATMFARHQILAMEKCFTDAQGELEFSVELLSDVVARKRLRASQHDIRRSALAARAKRIEMEDMLLGMEVAEATERAVREATIRENKEERSVLLAKKRSSLTTGATAKADLRGLAALSIDESLQRVAAASRRQQARTRASAGGPMSRRASSARRGLPEAPVGLYEGFDPADAGDDASENVLRELISDLRAQQRAAGITGRNTDVDQFEALLQSYDLENLPMAPTASEAQGGGISAFQRAEPASARRRASRKTKKRTVSDPTRASSSGSGSSTGKGSSGSFGAAAAATPASPKSTPGKNLPSTSAHSSPVRIVNSGDLSDSSSEVSDSDSSRFEEDEEDSDAEATRQQAELRQRHLERTSTSTSTSGSRNSSGRVESMFRGTQEEQLRRLEQEQAEEEAQEAGEEEEGDYELHRAILASLNLGPGEYGTPPPSGTGTATDGSASSLQERGPAQDTLTGREAPTDIDTEARVASLVEMMGCSEEAALQALTQSGFRVEAALDRLLSGG